MVRVKICGITNVSDARAAETAGADAVGFVFAKSPRQVTPEKAVLIIRALGPWIAKVGVFVHADFQTILRTVRHCGLTAVQLHGDEPDALARRLRKEGVTVIRAVRVGGALDRRQILKWSADAYLFDTRSQTVFGGTGRRFDWALLKKFKAKKPIIVSGGLNPGNVRLAVKTLKPYGVDTSSGVERSPGKKDPVKLKKFVHRAKSTR